MAFRPGPGVGGHCIPVDPTYLSHRVKAQLGYAFRMVELAEEINTAAPLYVANRVWQGLNDRRIAVNGAKILLLGVTYKANISDRRESPADPLARRLLEWGAQVSYHDPYVAEWQVKGAGITLKSHADLQSAVADADLVVLLQAHSDYLAPDALPVGAHVLDTRAALRPSTTVVRL
jgi:nucleotide sugar dehydrogenase